VSGFDAVLLNLTANKSVRLNFMFELVGFLLRLTTLQSCSSVVINSK